MKKIFILALALLLFVSVMVSCGSPSDSDGNVSMSDSAEAGAEETVEYVTFVENELSEYTIIYPHNNIDIDAAYRFSYLVSLISGADISARKDTMSQPSEKEILIGKTNRQDESDENNTEFIADAYSVRIDGECLSICAATADGYEAAFAFIFKEAYGVDDISNIKEQKEIPLRLKKGLDVLCEPSLSLEENKTLSGDKYSVSGVDKTMYNYCVSDGTVSYTFDNVKSDAFNTYSVMYSSDTVVKGILKYTVNGEEYAEEFFLEAGMHKRFISFIDRATDKSVTGVNVTGVEFTLLKGKNITFRLEDFSMSVREIPSENVIYISDARYKLGIKLTWGGGISYLEDLCDNDSSLTNLLNDHDTGRLVQQSYYGTNKAPYECGIYGGNTWGYNPVQGGDQYNNRSKLIDYKISDDGKSIYVKCRPLDWAKNNVMTPSYMENTYTLCGGYVKVDNRFVDFSGYVHRNAHQELPAFYTVSYLSEFVYYAGKDAWTNGALSVKKDLLFWAGNSDAYFALSSKEAWCAWVSANGYGIGVYTPIAEQLLAGRFSYNGSKDAGNNATNYVAPLISKTLKSYEPFEYSYYIATGNTEEIRTEFFNVANANK